VGCNSMELDPPQTLVALRGKVLRYKLTKTGKRRQIPRERLTGSSVLGVTGTYLQENSR